MHPWFVEETVKALWLKYLESGKLKGEIIEGIIVGIKRAHFSVIIVAVPISLFSLQERHTDNISQQVNFKYCGRQDSKPNINKE